MRRAHKQLLVLAAMLALATVVVPVNVARAETILPLDHPMAPFLESREYATAVGATSEFYKMEWVAFDPSSNRLYWAMSEVTRDMSDSQGDVQLPENNCGIIYAGELDDEYNVHHISPYITGGPYDPEVENGNRCAVDNIANPDGLAVDAKGNLWIGEDTEHHVNNMIWKWDGETLSRYAAVPLGAEVTGIFLSENGTIFFNAQHPSSMNFYPYNRAVVGAVNGFATHEEFEPLPLPQGADQHRVNVAAGEYQVLTRVGTDIPDDIYKQRYGQVDRLDGLLQLVCNSPDGNIFLPIDDAGTEGYLFTNYECRPGGVSKIYIRFNGEEWEVLEGENIDFSAVNGIWNNCGANVTPWKTGLSAEEYEPVASIDGWHSGVWTMSEYLGEQATPYDYGYMVELFPDTDGGLSTGVQKQYAMGRFSHENAVIMPDQKTVYYGDDDEDGIFFKYVADVPGDLSAGTLFAAKVDQKEDESFDLEWIELGKGNNEVIAQTIGAIELPVREVE